jgi:uridylate kinase
MGVEVGVVVGGGNIFRGVAVASKGGDRVTGDHMGMLATVINALALATSLRQARRRHRGALGHFHARDMPELFAARRCASSRKGRVVIFAGGTGNPFFTTDSAAALRAAEMGAEAILKGTQVDGIYSADPKKFPDAIRFENITHDEVLNKGLAVMDVAAVALARENSIPIVVFSIHEKGAFAKIMVGEGRATIVRDH